MLTSNRNHLISTVQTFIIFMTFCNFFLSIISDYWICGKLKEAGLSLLWLSIAHHSTGASTWFKWMQWKINRQSSGKRLDSRWFRVTCSYCCIINKFSGRDRTEKTESVNRVKLFWNVTWLFLCVLLNVCCGCSGECEWACVGGSKGR